jgi:hypothetical protein
MKTSLHARPLLLALMLWSATAMAAPGAHGPNGEHLDAPAQQGAASAAPKLEAKSELFELVATLGGGELSILIDKFDSNEPVLGAKVEVEAGPLKAIAKFHSDLGDYSVEDPALLKALSQPGEHALVFTVAAAGETDLLDGTLQVSPADAAHADDHTHFFTFRRVALAGAALLAGAAALVLLLRRRAARGGLR